MTGERTIPATERRRREAAERGEVARSTDLVTASLLLAAMLLLGMAGPGMMNLGKSLMRASFVSHEALHGGSVTPQMAAQSAMTLGTQTLSFVGPFLLLVMVVACLATWVQSGVIWVPSLLWPRWERLNPIQTAAKWGSLDCGVAIVTSLLKLVILSAIAVAFIQSRLPELGTLFRAEPATMLKIAARNLHHLGLWLSGTLFVLALLDYGYRYWRHEVRLRMTVEELKQEQRNEEANKQTRREQTQREQRSPQQGEPRSRPFPN